LVNDGTALQSNGCVQTAETVAPWIKIWLGNDGIRAVAKLNLLFPTPDSVLLPDGSADFSTLDLFLGTTSVFTASIAELQGQAGTALEFFPTDMTLAPTQYPTFAPTIQPTVFVYKVSVIIRVNGGGVQAVRFTEGYRYNGSV
jgi:hypothetical protein